ncbi:BQ2448_3994 [Microbotryum intermedium]|uniref:BQ2448_3994 protein n=1 Tax=Microbotryum intermedium TaxID=269621 RepID=A0A238FGU3_9BASI|nr:BQ2448_3994 [Microbotryum intermedium]
MRVIVATPLLRSLARPTLSATIANARFARSSPSSSSSSLLTASSNSTRFPCLSLARPFSSSRAVAEEADAGAAATEGGATEDAAVVVKKPRKASTSQQDKEKLKAQKLKQREKEKARKDKEKAAEKKKKEQARLKAAEKKKKDQLKLKAKAKATPKPRITSRLNHPKQPMNTWSIFLARYTAERKASHNPADGKFPSVVEIARDAAPAYRDLSPSEKAELLRTAEEQKAAFPQVLAEWTASLTPEMIREENAIRARRKKLGKSRKGPMRLEGQPKRPASAYIMWTSKIRNEQGIAGEVLKGETNILEQSKLLAAAWKSLSTEERSAMEAEQKEALAAYQEAKAAFQAKLQQSTSA